MFNFKKSKKKNKEEVKPKEKTSEKEVEPKEEKKEEGVKKTDFYGKGKIAVISIEKKEINDVLYNEVKLIDGTTILASNRELRQNLNLE